MGSRQASHASALKQRTRSRLAPGIASGVSTGVAAEDHHARPRSSSSRDAAHLNALFDRDLFSVLMAKNLFALSLDLVNEECCE